MQIWTCTYYRESGEYSTEKQHQISFIANSFEEAVEVARQMAEGEIVELFLSNLVMNGVGNYKIVKKNP